MKANNAQIRLRGDSWLDARSHWSTSSESSHCNFVRIGPSKHSVKCYYLRNIEVISKLVSIKFITMDRFKFSRRTRTYKYVYTEKCYRQFYNNFYTKNIIESPCSAFLIILQCRKFCIKVPTLASYSDKVISIVVL